GAIAMLLTGARSYAPLARVVLRLAQYPGALLGVATGIAVVTIVLSVLEHRRRLRTPPLPRYALCNRAAGYGLGLALALQLYVTSKDAGSTTHLSALLDDSGTQLVVLGSALGFAVVAYVGWLHPLCGAIDDELPPYQRIVEALRNTYDFVLGV